MKLFNYKFLLKHMLGMMLVLGLYPLWAVFFLEQGFFQDLQWGLWLLFYFFISVTFIFYTVTELFLSRSSYMYLILYINMFVGITVILKLIPMPLGMTLAFTIPILVGAFLHPYWGAVVGFFSVFISSIISGGIGPWTPIQAYLFTAIAGVMIWVPGKLRTEKIFLLPYGFVTGFLYGILMNLYFWPIVSTPIAKQDQGISFIAFYISTSLVWDVFRAVGNVIFIWVLYKPIQNALPQDIRHKAKL